MHGTQFNVRKLYYRNRYSDEELTWMHLQQINTLFTCGYIVGMIPSTSMSQQSRMGVDIYFLHR